MTKRMDKANQSIIADLRIEIERLYKEYGKLYRAMYSKTTDENYSKQMKLILDAIDSLQRKQLELMEKSKPPREALSIKAVDNELKKISKMLQKPESHHHHLVKILTDEYGHPEDEPVWCLAIVTGGSNAAFCSGIFFGHGESEVEFREKYRKKGGITCENCLSKIKEIKRIKL